MKLSDYVVRFFEKQKVKDMFMVSGGGCMHLVNSFGSSDKIKFWCTQHEQAAAMAAEGYAKMRNDLCVVLTTSGPGATNTITGVLDCYQDSIPVVFISGQAKRKQTVYNSGIESLRQFGVQEANIIPIVQSITKYAVEVNEPKKIRYYLEKAVYEAKSGRPGPVWLSIPLDVQSANINVEELEGFDDLAEKKEYAPTKEELEYFVAELKRAQRPVIIAGHGVRLADACKLLETFVHKYQIPVVTPIMGIDVLGGDDECNIGRVGTKGTRAGNFAMQNADLILSFGSRLAVSVVGHEYEMFAREAKIIVVDIDKEEHTKKTIDIDKLINSDIKRFIKDVESYMGEVPVHSEWIQKCQEWKKKYPVVLPEYEDDSKGINYYKFIDILNKNMSSDMPVVSDAGSAFYVVAQAVDLKEGQRHITTGGTATMGFTLPAAIGVSVAQPDSAVVAVTGEGSFMQNLQEMEVLKYHNMNIKVFVMNNAGYFSIHQTQKKFFAGNFVGEGVESGISFTNLEKLAYAFDVSYYKLENISQSNEKLSLILNEKGPAIIEVMVTTEMEVIPTNASLMREDGVLVSKPLEDMYPFLKRDEFFENMIISPVEEKV